MWCVHVGCKSQPDQKHMICAVKKMRLSDYLLAICSIMLSIMYVVSYIHFKTAKMCTTSFWVSVLYVICAVCIEIPAGMYAVGIIIMIPLFTLIILYVYDMRRKRI